MTGWTFGAEFELADIPRHARLPAGFGWDDRDCTIVNSNGVANDPKGKLYHLGGEINTPPTETISGQQVALLEITTLFPEARINYRCNLHLHIRVPGLKDDLKALKRLAMYNDYWLPLILPIIEPIPEPKAHDYLEDLIVSNGTVRRVKSIAYHGAVRRYRRRKRSHHTVLPASRIQRQLAAHTLDEFFRAEVPQDKQGRPMWHAQARAAVNLRQLLQTDTIEFRHFSGTLDVAELRHCFLWCETYLLCALCPTWGLRPSSLSPIDIFQKSVKGALDRAISPAFPDYDHTLEIRYRKTCHDGTVPKDQIAHNIKMIEDGTVNDEAWERSLRW